MNTVICAINSKYIHSSLAPWYLAAGIKACCGKNISVRVIEGSINDDINTIAERIIEENPRAIGLSCYIWNIKAVTSLASILKNRLPEAAIILGGPEVSFNAEEVLKSMPYVDFVISGEGEKPFALLLNAILNGSSPHQIRGICCRKEGRIMVSEPYTETSDPPDPYTDDYFKALGGRIAYLETSRGCPYSCAFCLSGSGKVRFFDLERSKKHILMLANSGAKIIKLVDRTFNADRKRAYKLFEFIISNSGKEIPEGVCFHFEIAGDLLDEKTLSLLDRSPPGLIQMEIGLQSFNTETLSAINRKTDIARLKENIRKLVSKENIHIHIDLIAGLPFEDMASFIRSFNTAFELKPHMLQLGFLKLLHGSAMRENPDKYPCFFNEAAPYEVTRTPWLSQVELELLHYTEDSLERLYNSRRFLMTVDYIIKQTGVSPFEFFSQFGLYCAKKNIAGISLNDYTNLAFDYFSQIRGIDKGLLRDVMACDFLSVYPAGRLPPALKIKDPYLKFINRRLLELEQQDITGTTVYRGAVILYSMGCAAYSGDAKSPVTGRYPLKFIKFH